MFDLIEWQQKAKDMSGNPKKLFDLWEQVCRLYEQNKIGQYELDEMREVIHPALRVAASIKKLINEKD